MPIGKLGFLENVSDERLCDIFGVFGSVTPKPTVFVFRAFLKLLSVGTWGRGGACTVRFDLVFKCCLCVAPRHGFPSETAWSLQDTRGIFGHTIFFFYFQKIFLSNGLMALL